MVENHIHALSIGLLHDPGRDIGIPICRCGAGTQSGCHGTFFVGRCRYKDPRVRGNRKLSRCQCKGAGGALKQQCFARLKFTDPEQCVMRGHPSCRKNRGGDEGKIRRHQMNVVSTDSA